MEDPLGLPGNDPGLRGERALPIPVIQLLQVLTVALGAPGVTDVIARVEARLLARRFFRWEQRSGASSEPGDVVAARSAPGWLFRSRQGSTDDRRTPAMPKKLKHKDTEDTDTQTTQAQTTQAQSTDGQGTGAQGTEDQSRGEQARPYLKNASYPARREDLAASVQQQGADQDVVDLIVVIPDDEYADVDAVIVQIELVDANA